MKYSSSSHQVEVTVLHMLGIDAADKTQVGKYLVSCPALASLGKGFYLQKCVVDDFGNLVGV